MKYIKHVYLILILLLFSISFTFQKGNAREYFFKTDSYINISTNNTNLGALSYEDGDIKIPINISYEYERYSRPDNFPFKTQKPTNIVVSIESKPDWCYVSLNDSKFSVDIENFLKGVTIELNTVIFLFIKDYAPAFENGKILLKALAEENGNIQSSSDTLELSLMPDAVPIFDYEIAIDSYNLSPGETIDIPISIENIGNCPLEINITAESLEHRYNYLVVTPNIFEISPGGNHTTYIVIKAEESNGDVNITEDMYFYIGAISTLNNVKCSTYIAGINITVSKITNDSYFIKLIIFSIIFIILIIITIYFFKKKYRIKH